MKFELKNLPRKHSRTDVQACLRLAYKKIASAIGFSAMLGYMFYARSSRLTVYECHVCGGTDRVQSGLCKECRKWFYKPIEFKKTGVLNVG